MWIDGERLAQALPATAGVPGSLLLRSLSPGELERLTPFLREMRLTPRRVLQHAGLPIEHVYFIEEGLVSVLAKVDERSAVEVGLIGRDGVVGATVVLGAATASFCHYVQVSGRALKIGVGDLKCALPDCPQLQAALQSYLHLSLIESAQATACSLSHAFEQRLATWLLMAHDRSDLDHFPITQDLLARSLGVRRPTVSEAFKLLQARGVFARERASIRILDRLGLEQIACRCFRTICRQRDAWKRSALGRKTFVALSLACALFEIELAAQ
jgi:CRP-like cAMP-binding protein